MHVERNIIETLERNRLIWNGHLKGLKDGRIPKDVTEWESE